MSPGKSRSPGVWTVLVAALGVVLIGYGLLLVQTSILAAAWLAVSGLCLLVARLIATEWARERLGLSAERQRAVSLAFDISGAVLLALFVVVNVASFEAGGILR